MSNDQRNNFNYVFKHSNRYKFLKPLGKGAYGYVISAYDNVKQKKVAIKRVSNLGSHLICTRTLREIKLLKHFRNEESIIRIESCIVPETRDFNEVFMIIELMEADLHYIIYSNQYLGIQHVRYLFFQILCGLDAIHKAGVIHRDLKPANCLVNSKCQLKICDFGLAREGCEGDVLTNYVQTRWYRAPELLFGEKSYTSKVDLWSAGCILAELILRKPLMPGKSTREQKELLVRFRGKPTMSFAKSLSNENAVNYVLDLPEMPPVDLFKVFPCISVELVDLIDNLLVYSTDERFSAAQALNHKFFYPYEVAEQKSLFYEDIVDDKLSAKELRKHLLSEILSFHKDNMIEKSFRF
ncbi:CMGC/MAPK protein kinase [Edhazardia aedis USNM 41457]|uniref:CMGC/MAPK protein kinase n=1 Tax=Edhazardia aedis (strain USNM 41457) TaxID=1003232 RepID=J9A070_EDHAE|nr:CMGC/MAPK protein kinase [Edhazardia aedis USNM 41457]|eukprot:EJW05303.1 CMGC/MAPK protein kinase [Edhazardia aedis USNM 41457]